jgi:hypothetical protein
LRAEDPKPARFREFVVSGGGTKNATLMRMIREELAPLKMRVRTTDDFGLPSEAKEATAFALLAYQTWRRLPSNVPSATGAERPRSWARSAMRNLFLPQRHREHRDTAPRKTEKKYSNRQFWLKNSVFPPCAPTVLLGESGSFSLCLCVSVVFFLAGCARKPDPNTLVMIIESSPINLDPRVGVDSQSQRIDELLFDSLLRHDDHFQLQPSLADAGRFPIL